MCARFTLSRLTLGDLVTKLAAELDPSAVAVHLPRYNVAPSQTCIIALDGAAAPVLTTATWGMRLGGHPVVNLRYETAGRRPGLRRCLVPTDGFYEWTGPKGHRQPIWFHRPDQELLLLAGLLQPAANGPGGFAVLTGPARPPVSEIHDRMPIVLDVEHGRRWLVEGGRPEPDEIELQAVEVSPRVNSAANDDAALLKPAPRQQRLLG